MRITRQEPIIKPIKRRQLEVEEKDALVANYSLEFMAGLMQNPDLMRNVAVIGHLHHGKTVVRMHVNMS
jgi:U5 small nuclear ribonucleoprotein component